MKSVLISIQPEWCKLIADGKKTVEVRKTRPRLETPFKVYIYCTNQKPFLVWGDVFRGNWETEITTVHGYSRKDADAKWGVFNGRVLGEFICDRIDPADIDHIKDIARAACLSLPEMWEYGRKSSAFDLFGWHISDLVIYDEPKELTEFYKPGTLSNGDFEYQLYDGSGDPRRSSYASYLFTQAIRKPPQSWCYVEEV